ncbi:MAG: nitrilase-related carbon-nitrogen hydrolase, partial [Oscillospiraceae bacterium]
MKDGFIKTACAAPDIRVADCRYNAEQLAASMRELDASGARLIVFPELCLTGYTCGDLFGQSVLLEGAERALGTLIGVSARLEAVTLVGLPVAVDGRLYNCAAVFQRGRLLGVVPKSNLPNSGEFYERRSFSPAPQDNTVVTLCGQAAPFGTRLLFCCSTLPDLVLAVEICEDLWVASPPSAGHARAGATVIANLSASDELAGKAAKRRALVEGQSARLLCGYLYADAGYGESTTDLVFSGHCLIAESGTLLAEAAPFSGNAAISELDVQRLQGERRRKNAGPAPEGEDYLRIPFPLSIEPTAL